MTTKADFSTEEWQSIVQAPMAIGGLVTLASPAIGDAMKESMSVAKKLAELAQNTGNEELLGALAAEFKSRDTAKEAQLKLETRDPAAVKAQMLAVVQSAAAAIDAKAGPDEATKAKQWLYSLGEAAANAAKEGDFMGIGGQRVSPEEEAVLGEIKTALGI